MGKKSPCKDCPNRYLGCHDVCVPYKEFQTVRETIRTNKVKYYKQVDEHVSSVERSKR